MEGEASETLISLLNKCSKQLFFALQENEMLRSRNLKLEGGAFNSSATKIFELTVECPELASQQASKVNSRL